MKRLRRTEIRIERREISIFLPTDPATEKCPVCGGPCFCTALDDVAAALGLDTARIRQALDHGRIHGQRSADGQLHICANSLLSGQSGD